MKKIIAALLLLTMVLALAGSAMAACNIKANMWVEFKKDATAYTAAKSGKSTKNVVQKGSHAWCTKVCGKYAKVLVNEIGETYCWFKTADLKATDKEYTRVIWAKGGKGMSTCLPGSIDTLPEIKGFYVKVSGHTNLRKNPGLKCRSQGVVEKGDLLKLTGRYGGDNRGALWMEVCRKGKKLWLSMYFITTDADGGVKYYDKDGNCAKPVFD